MTALAWSQVRAHPARLAAVLLAIVLGTAFLAATSVFAATSAAGLRVVAAAPLTAADVVVDHDPEADDQEPAWPGLVADHPDVTAVTPVHARTVELATDDQRATANVYSVADAPSLRWFDLAAGAWPAAADEVVADTATLSTAGLTVGDTVRLTAARGTGEESRVTVVGAADLGFRPLTGVQYQLYASEDFFGTDTPVSALARVADGASAEATAAELDTDLPRGLSAMTAEEQSEMAADRFAGGARQLDLLLLAFALVALLAAAVVITNTFTVVLAQRRRDTALLRLVGATRSQVRGLVVAEASITGTAGALLGVAVGAGAGYAGASMMGLTGAGLHVNAPALAGSFLVGVAVTVCAAWFPARRAAGTPPVEALRSASVAGAARLGPLHAVGAATALLGTAAMVAGAASHSLPWAVAGGSAGAIGLLMVLRHVISRLLAAAYPLLRRVGGVAGLAGANLRRDTGRAATATLSLVLGLALISALATASATGRATIDSDLRDRYPVDVSARADTGSVAPGTLDSIAGLDSLETVEAVRTAESEVGGLGPVLLVGLSPHLARTTGADELTGGGSGPPVMLVSGDQLTALGAAAGETASVTVDGAARTFTLVPSALATASGVPAPVVRADVLEALDPGADRGMVWGVAAPGADRDALAEQMSRIAAADSAVTLSGALSERRDITEILDVLVGLSLAMLAVTVVIAAAGVANTLGLSVLERTRESALLRALGLTRSGLRGALAVEAVVITVLGALLGVLIGVPYGVVGVDAVVGDTAPLVVSVPWDGLGLVLLASLAVGAVATVAPARRAVRVAPAEGLGGA
ncbi:ABC transporter permease [Nocardiopsis sp. CT-R113]|uniref:ABC transporter permease n=1 Tax=Nocardiopsis codii TaxID=3065942 RepID=A0ABU7K9T2_9ACTN|nr:ABC transporter permease [Nocardiopsis sp. CT-R113]MEE2039000.1 ABC transporter permease [Nocardiopsis sp. CT-R113]